jgi:hypothetical protein
MKKMLIGVAALPLLALLATSCAQEIVETKGDGEKYINYGVAAGKQTLGTRAAEINLATLQSDQNGIGVEVFYDGLPASYSNERYTLTYVQGAGVMGDWQYNNGTPVLHPAGAIYHYSTYPPVLNNIPGYTRPGGHTTPPSFPYTVSDNSVTPHQDLIAASYKTTNDNQAAATANLTYRHLLSQINFAVVGLEGYRVNVSNVSLNNVYDTNTFTFVQADAVAPAAGYPGSWDTPSGSGADYSYNGTGQADNFATTSITPVTIGNGTNALMVMPQELHGNTLGPNFSFSYTIQYNNGGNYVNIPGGAGTVEVDLTDTAMFPDTKEWEPGKRYLYVIYFESPVIIKYVVQDVEEWEDGFTDPGIPVDVDNNRNGEEGAPGDPAGSEHDDNENAPNP